MRYIHTCIKLHVNGIPNRSHLRMYVYWYSPVMYRKVGSLWCSIVLSCILCIITQLYSLPFLTSFIIMSSTIIFLPLELCPASMPLCNAPSVYGPKWFTSHPIWFTAVMVKLHNSSTSWPGWAITMPGSTYYVM